MHRPPTQTHSKSSPLAQSRVAVVGMGLMGGSLALALRGHCAEVIGIDPDPEALRLAAAVKAANHLTRYPADGLPGADLIVLAAPVGAILRIIAELPQWHTGSPMVLDLGSTKTDITAAMQALPARFDVIGGHPMCGKEVGGMAAAEARLYQGCTFVLSPLERTSPRALALASELVDVLQAKPLWLDAETHDHWAAAVSHLPYLVANALAAAAAPEAVEAMAGPGYRSTTRVAATPTTIMLDILLTNRSRVLAVLTDFRRHLDALEDSLKRGDADALRAQLDEAAERRRSLPDS
jgi:prephenate dehydrogenase